MSPLPLPEGEPQEDIIAAATRIGRVNVFEKLLKLIILSICQFISQEFLYADICLEIDSHIFRRSAM